jgi:hypothetical protein
MVAAQTALKGEAADRRTPTVYQVLPHRAVGIVLRAVAQSGRRYTVTVTVLFFRYSVTEASHMALSTTDRQRAYREKIRRGELKRFQFALPLETGIKVDYLCDALQCNRTELFSRLILEEWKRQGEPLHG